MIAQRTCPCGAPVKMEIPDDAKPFIIRLAQRVTLLCDVCAARQEQEDAEREQAERDRDAQARFRSRLMSSGLPAALRGREWDSIDRAGRERVVDAARAWSEWTRPTDPLELATVAPGLLLTGPIGVGKTTIAAAAAWAWLTRRRLQWTSVPVLFAQLGAGHNQEARDHAAALLTGTEALVLDDLDKARATQYGAEQVFAAIDNRITEGAPLLVTTNLTIDELAQKFPDPFGEAIASRLVGYCRAFTVPGRDRRTHKLAAA